MAAVTQIRYKHSDGRAYYDKKLAEGKTPKEALRALKRQISDAIYKRLKADAARAAAPAPRAREGNRGTTLSPARPAHTPNTGSSAKPLPDLPPPYDARLTSRKGHLTRQEKDRPNHLTQRGIVLYWNSRFGPIGSRRAERYLLLQLPAGPGSCLPRPVGSVRGERVSWPAPQAASRAAEKQGCWHEAEELALRRRT